MIRAFMISPVAHTAFSRKLLAVFVKFSSVWYIKISPSISCVSVSPFHFTILSERPFEEELAPWPYLFFNRKYTLTICKIRICAFWYARLDSNQRPSESESDALSNWATGTYLVLGFCDSRQIVVNDHSFFLCHSRKRRRGKALRHISTGNAWNVGV